VSGASKKQDEAERQGYSYVCTERLGKNECRRTVHVAPLLSPQNCLEIDKLMRCLQTHHSRRAPVNVANGEFVGKIARLEGLNKNTVVRLFDLLSSAVDWRNDDTDD
jgi:hypothetical protein